MRQREFVRDVPGGERIRRKIEVAGGYGATEGDQRPDWEPGHRPEDAGGRGAGVVPSRRSAPET